MIWDRVLLTSNSRTYANMYTFTYILQMSSGSLPSDLRPSSPNPWLSNDDSAEIIVRLSENMDKPKYISSLMLSNMDNLAAVEMSLIKDGEQLLVEVEERVSIRS